MLNVLAAAEREDEAFDYVVFWDADLATPLRELLPMRRLVREHHFDAVFCSRVKRLGSVIRHRPLRHVLGRVFATVASLMLRLPVYDTQSGCSTCCGFRPSSSGSASATGRTGDDPASPGRTSRRWKRGHSHVNSVSGSSL